jgi:Protein of unknown function (DUF3604)
VLPIGSTVDVVNATYANTIGAVELKGVWTDPDFDPSLDAFYYARMLEIPTPRWTTIQARQLNIPPPDVVPPTIQERAWSSPIWYSPSEEERAKAPKGILVASLTEEGAETLTDEQLKALIIGKSIWVRNTVTGGMFKEVYDSNGQAVVYHVGGTAILPSEVGDVAEGGYLGTSNTYVIKDGKIVTFVAGTPFELVVYKKGDNYFAARSNEFGYANYEIMPEAPENLIELPKDAHVPREAQIW